MRGKFRAIWGVTLGVVLLAGPAWAQYGRRYYPGGMGRWGWSGWVSNPNASFMSGMGSYARGQGVYNLETAKAQSIERDSLIRWNKAMMAQQKVVQAQLAKEEAAAAAETEARAAANQLHSGKTLNALLYQILEFNPDGSKATAAKAVLGPDLIRDIPYETATEGVTFCIDQLTDKENFPFPLSDDRYDAERQALSQAVDIALTEDVKGSVSPGSLKTVRERLNALRAAFEKATADTDPGYLESEAYLKSLAGLTGLLANPNIQPILAELDSIETPTTIGHLIGFMHFYNLKFGPAQTDRQRAIYERLDGMLAKVLQQVQVPDAKAPPAPPEPGRALGKSAGEVFGNMSWNDLDASAKPSR